MRSTLTATVLAIAAVTALTACVDQSAPLPTLTGTTGESVPINEGQPRDDAEVTAAPEAGKDSRQEALEAATTALSTFAQPQLGYDTWWEQMLPLLSQQGAIAYEGTDPSQIPVHQVTGAGVVVDGSTEVSLIVQLPTDAGLYNVSLTRQSAADSWLADRIRPAAS